MGYGLDSGPNTTGGSSSRLSLIRDLPVAQHYRIAGVPFVDTTIDTNFWTNDSSGTGAAFTQSGGLATVVSGTDNNGYGGLHSAYVARYMFAHPMMWRAAIRIPDLSEAECTRRWGAYTVSSGAPQEGFYFEIDDAGALSVVCVKGGTPTAVASGSFNGAVDSYTMDTNVHAFEIEYFTLGADFYIDDILVHKLDPTTVRLTATNHLPISVNAVNSATGTESGAIEVWDSVITRYGRPETEPVHKIFPAGQSADVECKRGAGSLHAIIFSAITANAQVVVYDSLTAAGTILFDSGAMPAKADPFTVDFAGLPFHNGLTFKVITADCALTMIYE
jgi:hypothetical protein